MFLRCSQTDFPFKASLFYSLLVHQQGKKITNNCVDCEYKKKNKIEGNFITLLFTEFCLPHISTKTTRANASKNRIQHLNPSKNLKSDCSYFYLLSRI